LEKVEVPEKLGQREAAKTDTKTLLFKFSWWMKKEDYSESTIITRRKLLDLLLNVAQTYSILNQ